MKKRARAKKATKDDGEEENDEDDDVTQSQAVRRLPLRTHLRGLRSRVRSRGLNLRHLHRPQPPRRPPGREPEIGPFIRQYAELWAKRELERVVDSIVTQESVVNAPPPERVVIAHLETTAEGHATFRLRSLPDDVRREQSVFWERRTRLTRRHVTNMVREGVPVQ